MNYMPIIIIIIKYNYNIYRYISNGLAISAFGGH